MKRHRLPAVSRICNRARIPGVNEESETHPQGSTETIQRMKHNHPARLSTIFRTRSGSRDAPSCEHHPAGRACPRHRQPEPGRDPTPPHRLRKAERKQPAPAPRTFWEGFGDSQKRGSVVHSYVQVPQRWESGSTAGRNAAMGAQNKAIKHNCRPPLQQHCPRHSHDGQQAQSAGQPHAYLLSLLQQLLKRGQAHRLTLGL